MEPIQTALNKWLKNSENFQESLQTMKKQVLSSPEVKQFLDDHPELTRSEIDKQLIKLYEYESQSKRCEKCDSLDQCCNVIQGFVPEISLENNRIKLRYSECPRKLEQLQMQEKRNLIKSLHMPREILEGSFQSILDFKAEGRIDAVTKIMEFYEQSKNGKIPAKGMYLYGQYGVGKTYLLAALANELTRLNIDTFFIYMPEFAREIRASINDSSINDKIDRFKNASVLVLDDIGAEYLSSWFRDEILSSILQYRMMERLPVFFTSNYRPKQLEENLSWSNKGHIEELKAQRIMERIYQVSVPVEVKGENYRNKIVD